MLEGDIIRKTDYRLSIDDNTDMLAWLHNSGELENEVITAPPPLLFFCERHVDRIHFGRRLCLFIQLCRSALAQ